VPLVAVRTLSPRSRTAPHSPPGAAPTPTCAVIFIQRQGVALGQPPAPSSPRGQIILNLFVFAEEQLEPAGLPQRRQRQLQHDNAGGPCVEAVGLVLSPQHGPQCHGQGRGGQRGGVRGQHILQQGAATGGWGFRHSRRDMLHAGGMRVCLAATCSPLMRPCVPESTCCTQRDSRAGQAVAFW
jgi:hypothetical protein